MRDEVKRTVTLSSCVSSVVLSGWGRSVQARRSTSGSQRRIGNRRQLATKCNCPRGREIQRTTLKVRCFQYFRLLLLPRGNLIERKSSRCATASSTDFIFHSLHVICRPLSLFKELFTAATTKRLLQRIRTRLRR